MSVIRFFRKQRVLTGRLHVFVQQCTKEIDETAKIQYNYLIRIWRDAVTPLYFDTHAHYDDKAFDGDRERLLSGLPSRGVAYVMNPGVDEESSRAAMDFARRFDHVYAAAGWHPHEARFFTAESEGLLRAWAKEPKVRAIGEIGLDFHYDFSPREAQRAAFVRQLELAEELDLPVIVHDRESGGACMEIVRAFPAVRGVFHSYSGGIAQAEELVARGWYLSFTGALTFKNPGDAPEVFRKMPLNRLMLETDSPYMAPAPRRGQRNDSTLLPLIAQKAAELRDMTIADMARITLENGKVFFGIKDSSLRSE